YGLGSAIQLLPAFRGDWINETAIGLVQSTYGLVGFLVGSVAIAPAIFSQMRAGRKKEAHTPHPEMPFAYLGIGFGTFLLSGALSSISGLPVVINTATGLFVVGLCMVCWEGVQGRKGRLIFGLVLTAFLPMITMATMGFMGIGSIVVIVVLCFLSSFYPSQKT